MYSRATHRIILFFLALLGVSFIMAYSNGVTSIIFLLMATLTWATITSLSSCFTVTIDSIIASLPAGLATLQDVAIQHFPSCVCLFQFGTFYVVPSQERPGSQVPPDSMLLDEKVSPSRPSNNPSNVKPKCMPTVSIKNHPQKGLIVALAQALFDSETKVLQDAKEAKDFLIQAKRLVKSSDSDIVITYRNPPPTDSVVPAASAAVLPLDKATVAPSQGKPTPDSVKDKAPLSYAAVTSSPVKAKPARLALKATNKGTRPTRLYSRVPQDAHDSLLSIRQDNNALYQSIKNTITLSPT